MNKVVLIGRLTADPNLSYAAGTGTAVCRFALAVTRPFKRDEADFINCVAFNKTAETIGQYLVKGRQIAVSGNIRTGSYEAQDGTKRYTTDVVVENFEFIGNSQNSGQSQDNNSDGGMNFDNEMTPVDDGDMPF